LEEKKCSTAQAMEIGKWMEEGGFARLLGIKVDAAGPGWCQVSMEITDDHLNSVRITHGGATFALADFAFGLASNGCGATAVGLTTTMSYPAASQTGDRLVAEAFEETRSKKTGNYRVEVRRSDNTVVGLFSGTVFVRGDAVSEWMNT
jgi:phenylacetic acid degradation protein PaaD